MNRRLDAGIRPSKNLAVPVWALLIVLAVVPTFGMVGFAWRDLSDSTLADERAEASAVSISDLVQLRALVHAIPMEHVPSQALVQAGDFGVTGDQASELLGFDLDEQLALARARTDARLGSISSSVTGGHPELAGLAGELADARSLVDGGAASTDEVNVAYLTLTERATAAADRELARLLALRAGASRDAMTTAVGSFIDAIEASDAGMEQIWALADSYLGTSSLATTQRLIASDARYGRITSDLDRQLTGSLASAWQRVRDDEASVRMQATIEDVLGATGSLAGVEIVTVGQIFSDSFVRAELLAVLVDEAGSQAVAVAGAERDAVQLQQRRTVGLAVALILLTLVVALSVSLVITRPLQRLAAGARSVSAGRIEDTHFTQGGPREISLVAAALDEAVVNLRRLEAQADALARGDLEDGVLASTVPNALGESLHRSVAQLSRSLRAQEELRDQLAHQASVDTLTKLPNRAGSIAAIEHALARTRRSGNQMGLLYVDLDGFKRANDDHGHSVGDLVLRAIADRLSSVVRSGDVVGRIGGDEFVIVAEPVSGVQALVDLGQRIVDVVSEPIEIDGRRSKVGASIGVALDQDSGADPAAGALVLLHDADHAVYRAKRAGRGRVEVFDEHLRREVAERLAVEAALRQGLDEQRFVLHYQPVVDTATMALRSFEALVRWDREGHDLVQPRDFIAIAEGSDLVIDLGRWVLGEATRQLVAWSEHEALAQVGVAVNLSGRHLLHTCVIDDVAHALAGSGLAPSRLTIEITETVVLGDNVSVIEHLQALRALGVQLAIDDFGTGYTSMSQLGLLPVDVLKIDRVFVDALRPGADRSVVELTVGVAHTLGLGLVAEGVERPEQLELLRELECDEIQGFLVATPLAADDVLGWVDAGDRRPLQH